MLWTHDQHDRRRDQITLSALTLLAAPHSRSGLVLVKEWRGAHYLMYGLTYDAGSCPLA
ncbi:hypothetical protein BQ8794_240021 [Mesorhizobium prunaredense]|uniref:Uncharacterized protein n=1 Tax=Mesorhizobium prunaredense TaxID=1631249 RepID=A0A1R3V7D9_9HYPH|nr:hypothetical protein BQ8794_240021 [Mesorhizobium prunaredense]